MLAGTLRTRPGRWLKPDVAAFGHATEDPERPGHVDLAAFKANVDVQRAIGAPITAAIQQYGLRGALGYDKLIVCMEGDAWPPFMMAGSAAGGGDGLPVDLDAAAELVTALIEVMAAATGGKWRTWLPAYVEPINEPEGAKVRANASQVNAFQVACLDSLQRAYPPNPRPAAAAAAAARPTALAAQPAARMMVGGAAMCTASDLPHNKYYFLNNYAVFSPAKQHFVSFHGFDSFGIYAYQAGAATAAVQRKVGGGGIASIMDLLTVYSALVRANASAAEAAPTARANAGGGSNSNSNSGGVGATINVTEWALPVLVSEHGLATDVAGLSDIFDEDALVARQVDSHWAQLMSLLPHADSLLGVSAFLIANNYAIKTNPSVALWERAADNNASNGSGGGGGGNGGGGSGNVGGDDIGNVGGGDGGNPSPTAFTYELLKRLENGTSVYATVEHLPEVHATAGGGDGLGGDRYGSSPANGNFPVENDAEIGQAVMAYALSFANASVHTSSVQRHGTSSHSGGGGGKVTVSTEKILVLLKNLNRQQAAVNLSIFDQGSSGGGTGAGSFCPEGLVTASATRAYTKYGGGNTGNHPGAASKESLQTAIDMPLDAAALPRLLLEPFEMCVLQLLCTTTAATAATAQHSHAGSSVRAQAPPTQSNANAKVVLQRHFSAAVGLQLNGAANAVVTTITVAPASVAQIKAARLRYSVAVDYAGASAGGPVTAPTVAPPAVSVNGQELVGSTPLALTYNAIVPPKKSNWYCLWRAWEIAVPPELLYQGRNNEIRLAFAAGQTGSVPSVVLETWANA